MQSGGVSSRVALLLRAAEPIPPVANLRLSPIDPGAQGPAVGGGFGGREAPGLGETWTQVRVAPGPWMGCLRAVSGLSLPRPRAGGVWLQAVHASS